jgi:phthalate 4,5-dioxygenase oxygenase subunit
VALSTDENRLLTEVGPGTMMGNLLRRYWTPACLSSELSRPRTQVRVRLLGEDLVAFRDSEGRLGLLEEHCPHRGASLYYGRNEAECGLRCVYHGWKFDTTGRCTDMPSEARSFAASIKATSYPTHESGGIIWTYMGPLETMTPFRDFGSDGLPESEIHASKIITHCNWVQTLDGNIDTVHASFLHQFNAIVEEPDDDTDRPGYPSIRTSVRLKRSGTTPRLEVHDDWYGFRYAGLRTTPNGHTHARISTYIIPYATQIATIPFATRQLLVVPIDDHSAWRYNYITQDPHFENPRNASDGSSRSVTGNPYRRYPQGDGIQERLFTVDNEYGIDRDVQNDLGPGGTFSGIPDHNSQDYMVTETMGPVYDRTREHLGTTDLAIVRFHAILLQAAKDLDAGQEAPAVAADLDYKGIRAAEKILEADEDWRRLGTNDDPIVQEALAQRA